ncbi:MAG: hypothetical protein ACPLN2_07990, partial [Thermoproteota archaeon]
QQSKIASLSEMLNNIAHQWRQPLSFISTAVTGLKIQKEYNQLDEKMFFEMRKYKESLILIAQFPSQIYPDLFKSCEVKVVHRLFSAGDATLIEDILGIDKNILEQLKSLPVGRVLVFIPSSRSPITVQVHGG